MSAQSSKNSEFNDGFVTQQIQEISKLKKENLHY